MSILLPITVVLASNYVHREVLSLKTLSFPGTITATMAIKQQRSEAELVQKPLTVKLPSHIIDDLNAMEKHAKIPVADIVKTALLMFIATHNDYLGRRK